MAKFTVHTIETAPAPSKALLEKSHKEWGFIPTLHGILAESAPTLDAYQTLFTVAKASSLPPAEQQVAYIAVSALHGCEYCVAGHTYLGRQAKLDESALQALRGGKPIPDAKLQALRTFAEAVVRERGHVGDAAIDAFLAVGFTRAQVLEVVLIVACKTISNYINHIAHTPKESFMSDPALGWTAPRRAA
ncbi:MAG: carboxymuconolactone decarboxylase family protein [Solimonas sp.]